MIELNLMVKLKMKSNSGCSNFCIFWRRRTFSIKDNLPNQQNGNTFFVQILLSSGKSIRTLYQGTSFAEYKQKEK
jgi:hypothetical protein